MTSIKFRAWDLAEGRWVIGEEFRDLVQFSERSLKLTCSDFLDEGEQQNVIIMQYLGVKDKKGKELCTGDIVQRQCPDQNCSPFHRGFVVMQTVFGATMRDPETNEEHPLFPCGMDEDDIEFEIIGNVFENPEILPHFVVKDLEGKTELREHD